MGKKNIPPILTICIVISIICIAVIGRGSLTTKAEISIPAISEKNVLLENDELNTSENAVLTILINGISLMDGQQDMEDNFYHIYVKYLKDYLSRSDVDLSTKNASEMVDDIRDIYAIMSLENESDLKKMSVDGRGVATHLFEKVYVLCGLKLVHNMHGDIIQISDEMDSIYVKNNPIKLVSFQLDALVITLVALIALFCLCIIIAKKNQLFVKEEIYNTNQRILDM